MASAPMVQSKWSQDSYARAWLFAARAHRRSGQEVPGTDLPYVVHVGLVAMEVVAALQTESLPDGDLAVQCALLHDTIEDTDVTYDALLAEFGKAVADGVLALSKDEKAAETIEDHRERKHRMMADSLARIRQQLRAVWLVKLADRITNLQPPPAYWTRDKRAAYLEESRLILGSLGEASAFLARRLDERMERYGGYVVAGPAA